MSLRRILKRQQGRIDHGELLRHIQKAEAELAEIRQKAEIVALLLGWNQAMHAYDCRGGTFSVRLTGSPLWAYADALEAQISARCYEVRGQCS